MVESFRYPPQPAGLPPDRKLIKSGDPHRPGATGSAAGAKAQVIAA
jgi:hypothetical protein